MVRLCTVLLALALATPSSGAQDLDEIEALTHRDFDMRLSDYTASDRLVSDVVPNRALDMIFVRLLAAAFDRYPAARRLRWELQLVRDDEISADCYSDGRILLGKVFLQRYVQDEDQLAFVLGHEMGHALAGHVRGYYLTAATKLKVVGLTSDLLISNVETDDALRMSLAPLSKDQELEADRIGVMLATAAGFRRKGAEDVLTGFMRDGGGLGDWTHDGARVRLEEVRRF
jgi:predicted Zn-dependent protease